MLREKDYFIRENLALCFKHLAEGKISVCEVDDSGLFFNFLSSTTAM